jgi:hypothetical protein
LDVAVFDEVIDKLLEVHEPRVAPAGPDDQMALRVDLKITGAPVLDTIRLDDLVQDAILHQTPFRLSPRIRFKTSELYARREALSTVETSIAERTP